MEPLTQALDGWVSSGSGERGYEADHTTAPKRITASATYQVIAADEREAERAAAQRFAADSVDSGVSGPATVVCHFD